MWGIGPVSCRSWLLPVPVGASRDENEEKSSREKKKLEEKSSWGFWFAQPRVLRAWGPAGCSPSSLLGFLSPTIPPSPVLGCSQTIKLLFVPFFCSAFNLRAPGPCESAPGVPPAVQVRRRHAAGVSFRGGFLSPFPSGLVFLPTCNPHSQAVGKLRNPSLILGIKVPILSRSNHAFENHIRELRFIVRVDFFLLWT